MTLNEFKAFLEGYETSFVDDIPTAEQYALIKEKLATVTVLANLPTPSPAKVLGDLYPPKVYFGNATGDVPPANSATWTCL